MRLGWLGQGSDLTVSVNVSARQLDRDGVIAHVAEPFIRTLVQLGKDLGLETLAEGVETTDQLDHLRKVSGR